MTIFQRLEESSTYIGIVANYVASNSEATNNFQAISKFQAATWLSDWSRFVQSETPFSIGQL